MKKSWISAGCLFIACLSSPAWSQSAPAKDASAGTDPFVAERNAVLKANQVYKHKVAAAQKEYDRIEGEADREYKKTVAEAKAERNKAVAAIKAGG
ncbi:DUF4398 domain-containing protein [Pararobbsia alpina]|uniref:hypothetical protein n=1 Tax=Pararobbsia alpina TaxID=621374 RepID=UPI0039A578B2